MAGYRIMSIIQFVLIAFAGLLTLDLSVNFGMNQAFFAGSTTGWWSPFALLGYLFAAVAILQLVKAITVED